ncbi:GNAT family N-acetyltransferase [Bacillaceae bacterium SIJ1]|uniref:GNAT family N-acetyltransferase n=1 Tax=Litoribacterium kuwaitense TaxID=1398745 RepID=UPI0013EB5FE5|nr:GNAT family protein [Litoribacterium kuwaitense]NGP44302.1 GNAT family N-acetyltransferase [Litoribacterium kuwaitense]
MFKRHQSNDIKLSPSTDVTVRLTRMSDVQPMYRLISAHRTQLRQWLGWVDHATSPDYMISFVQRSLEQYQKNDGFQAVIEYNGEVAGNVGFQSIDWFSKNTSLGYWLADRYTGKGVMTKAVSAMIDYAFYAYGLHRVEIRCATENEKSKRIPERLGFTLEGTVREAEWLTSGYVDHHIYGLLKKEWVDR